MMRRWGMWAALLFTLVACWWVEQADQTAAQTQAIQAPEVKRRIPLAQVLPALSVAQKNAIQQVPNVADEPVVNLFSAMEMPVDEIAEAQASVPVSPYTYAGRLQEDGRWTVFLTDGQQQYVLREGDKFAEGWKVAVLDQQKVVLQHAAERFEIRLDNGVVF